MQVFRRPTKEKPMIRQMSPVCGLLAGLLVLAGMGSDAVSQPSIPKDKPADAKQPEKELPFTNEFHVEPGELVATGRNPYFILEPGHYLVLKKGSEELTWTVLDETKKIGDVETRVIEEKETKNGKIV